MYSKIQKNLHASLIGVAIALASIHADAQQIITIGLAGPLTGISAAHGKDIENGVRMAIDEANAQGIKLGGQDVRFALESVDDQGDPRVGVQVAQKLVDDGVAIVLGHYNSGVTLPASKIYAAAGIPLIDAFSTNPAITRQGLDSVFRIIPTDAQNSGNAGRYAVTVTKAKRIAVMDDRTAFGQGEAQEFKKAVTAAGGTIVASEFTSDKAVEFNAQLTNIKGANADVLFFGGVDSQAALVAKRMKQLGMRTQFLGGGAIASPIFTQIAGEAAEGALAWEYGRPIDQLPGGREFAEKYKNKFGTDILTYSPFAYDATWIAITAMRQANSAKPAAVIPKLRSMHYTGITGKISFDQYGDLKNPSSTLYEVKGDKWVPVTTTGME